MSEQDPALDDLERAARDLVPQLRERLRRHGLGEIEVRQGDLRVRVSTGDGAAPPPARAAPRPGTAEVAIGSPPPTATPPSPRAAGSPGIASPAVGFFVYADGLGPGLVVEKGDPLGYVEMLGVRHDVRAPRAGMVRHLVAESGEAVEYGQVVVELGPVEAATAEATGG